jgi:hypothetical protein
VVAVSGGTFFPVTKEDGGTDYIREGSREGSDFVSWDFLLTPGSGEVVSEDQNLLITFDHLDLAGMVPARSAHPDKIAVPDLLPFLVG